MAIGEVIQQEQTTKYIGMRYTVYKLFILVSKRVQYMTSLIVHGNVSM